MQRQFEQRGKRGYFIQISRAHWICQRTEGPLQGSTFVQPTPEQKIRGTQIFYLVDEAQHTNGGANTVTSMLHHHFLYHGLGETDVKLHMDNCSGQNKNNTVIGYMCKI
uniref:Uncharacterized protein n=1 Tax=Magallana gigas TaxID=29159 RepID=K1QYW5_MAGGI